MSNQQTENKTEENHEQSTGTSCPPQPENNYDNQRENRGQRYGGNQGRGGGRGNFQSRGYQGDRPRQNNGPRRYNNNNRGPYHARPFVLDFNRFLNRVEIHERIMGNFNDRMEKGDTQELFHWSAPPLNDFCVGEPLSIRFSGETDIHQYVVMAKFLRGEISWLNAMPDNSKFDFRLKKIN